MANKVAGINVPAEAFEEGSKWSDRVAQRADYVYYGLHIHGVPGFAFNSEIDATYKMEDLLSSAENNVREQG